MAINKDKLRLNAQKYLQRGQLDKAIKELQRLVEEDPRDVRTILKIADLQARKGDTTDAIRSYGVVADFHTAQGFFLKSVAVYKQILKIRPDDAVNGRKLAELYRQLNLHSDAIAQYQQLVALHTELQQTDEAIGAMRAVAELDPHNIALRLQLAEAQHRHGQVDDATQQLTTLARELKELQRFGDYAQVLEGLLALIPGDMSTSHELSKTYLGHREPKRALATLHPCFRANPRNADTLTLLVEAFRALEQPDKALFLLRELAKLHHEAGATAAYHEVLREIMALDPNDTTARAELGNSGSHGSAIADTTTAAVIPSFTLQSLTYAHDDAHGAPTALQITPEEPAAIDQVLSGAGDDAEVLLPVNDAAFETVIAEVDLDLEVESDATDDVDREVVEPTPAPVLIPVAQPPPVHVALTPAPAPDAPTPLRDDPILLSKMLRQVDVYRKYNLHDKARSMLATLLAYLEDHPQRQGAHHDSLCALCRLLSETTMYQHTWYTRQDSEPPAGYRNVPTPNQSVVGEMDRRASHAAQVPPSMRGTTRATHSLLPSEMNPTIGQVRAAPAAQFVGSDLADGSISIADLADEIQSELHADVSPATAEISQVPMETVLAAFKEGVAATVDAHDAETHYNLGLAYKDMGLMREAIDAFLVACGAPQITVERHVAALSMLGQCYSEQGETDRALDCYGRALRIEALSPAQIAAVNFDMGRIFDALQRYQEAIDAYRRVYALDPHYRDVALKLAHVEERLQG